MRRYTQCSTYLDVASLVLIRIPTVYDLITPDDVIIVSSQKFGYLKDKNETMYISFYRLKNVLEGINSFYLNSAFL